VETPVDSGLSESLSLVKGRSCHSYTNHLTSDCSHLLIRLNGVILKHEMRLPFFVKHVDLVLCSFFSFFFTYENDKPFMLNYVICFPVFSLFKVS